jgi:hypothetical protein
VQPPQALAGGAVVPPQATIVIPPAPAPRLKVRRGFAFRAPPPPPEAPPARPAVVATKVTPPPAPKEPAASDKDKAASSTKTRDNTDTLDLLKRAQQESGSTL